MAYESRLRKIECRLSRVEEELDLDPLPPENAGEIAAAEAAKKEDEHAVHDHRGRGIPDRGKRQD